MFNTQKATVLVGASCVLVGLANAGCAEPSSGITDENADASLPDAGFADIDPVDAEQNSRDSGGEDVSVSREGAYRTIFANADQDTLYVTYRTESGVRLFSLGAERGWSELHLPEALRDEPRLIPTSVVPTEHDVLLSTRQNGAWRLVRDTRQWQAFAPDWFDGSGHITHLKKLRDRIYAFHEVDPNSPTGIELWQRHQLDWEYIRNDMFMIIDYMPRDEMSVRATRYGTIEVSYDAGETWQTVPDINGSLPPQLFEWGDDVAVMTTRGVWVTRDGAHEWEKLSIHGGEAAALLADELVVASRTGDVSAVSLDDRSVRTLPAIEAAAIRTLQLGVVGDSVVLANGTADLLMLTGDAARWESVSPAR